MNGYDIVISWGGSPIAYMKTHEVQTECDKQEVSSPTDGEWRKYIKGRKEWSVNASFLVAGVTDVTLLLNVGNTYTLVFRGRNAESGVSGSAILTKCRITANRGNLVQGSFSFKGVGALS